jgi:hypothetical protein
VIEAKTGCIYSTPAAVLRAVTRALKDLSIQPPSYKLGSNT